VSEPYEWLVAEPILHEPVLVVMMTGWIDAAGAGATAAAALSAECNTVPLVRFDDDTFIDYRARRPTMELRDGVNTNLVWATSELRSGHSADGRDILLLTGPEPDMAWHRYARAVSDIAVELDVKQMVAFGAYPFAAPHTRPPRLSCSSPSTDVLASVTFARSSVDVPAGMAAALEHALHARKIPALGIWVQVPHYVANMAYPAAAVALLDGLSEVTGITVAAPTLRADVAIQRQRLDQSVADNDDHMVMLHQLEEMYDAAEGDGIGNPASPERIDDGAELEMRSGDELAAEIQRFLNEQE
jgi:hypothetical protein